MGITGQQDDEMYEETMEAMSIMGLTEDERMGTDPQPSGGDSQWTSLLPGGHLGSKQPPATA